MFFSLEAFGDSIASDGAGPTATGGGGEVGSEGVQGGMGSWVLGLMSASKRSIRSLATFLFGGRGMGCGEGAFRSPRKRGFRSFRGVILLSDGRLGKR